jgi:hypothetical protein
MLRDYKCKREGKTQLVLKEGKTHKLHPNLGPSHANDMLVFTKENFSTDIRTSAH